ncbi:hypothetical protein GGR51DRAFT_556011 [Nemania sp. FL0031]|nr:hypothetical protein GGR51DRAFT_556011 [Nemania sp. FL0031]
MKSPIPPYLVNDITNNYAKWIMIEETIRTPNPNPPGSVSFSLGALDPIPTEVVRMVLDRLDAQSVARFACVSSGTNALVQAHVSYTSLIKNAPKALIALKKTGLIDLHSIDKLFTTLQSEKCTSCTHFGPFLFLPTCKRCCYNCLDENPLLRILMPGETKTYFGLTRQAIQQLPIFRAIPGCYGRHPRYVNVEFGTSERRMSSGLPLVSLEAAVDLGVMIHGSFEAMESAVIERYGTGVRELKSWDGDPVEEVEVRDALNFYANGFYPDMLFGMAFIPFPSVSKSGTVEHGFRCRGCLVNRETWYMTRIRSHNPIPSFETPMKELYRSYSAASFLSHIDLCDGVRRLRSVHDDVRNHSLAKEEFVQKAAELEEY